MPPSKPKTKASKQNKVRKVMHEYKTGKLRSAKNGKGGKVRSRKQAIAIAMSESDQSHTRKQPRKPKHQTAEQAHNTRV